jgi:hypothetical protein
MLFSCSWVKELLSQQNNKMHQKKKALSACLAAKLLTLVQSLLRQSAKRASHKALEL